MKFTGFLDQNRRKIYKNSNKYIVLTNKGVKYASKARYYYPNSTSSTLHIKYAPPTSIPSPIRPKIAFKARPRRRLVSPRGSMGIASLFKSK